MEKKDDLLLKLELLRWGIVHRNCEYYARPDQFWQWYEATLPSLGENEELYKIKEPLRYYLMINELLQSHRQPQC